MDWTEYFGYAGSCLVLLTFSMKSLLALRAVGICSNVAFLMYGVLAGLLPVIVLHALLFPLNAWRLWEVAVDSGEAQKEN